MQSGERSGRPHVTLVALSWAEALTGACAAAMGLLTLSSGEPFELSLFLTGSGALLIVAGWALSNRSRHAWVLQLGLALTMAVAVARNA